MDLEGNIICFLVKMRQEHSQSGRCQRKIWLTIWWEKLAWQLASLCRINNIKFTHIFHRQQSGAVEACWAHNPEVRGSKPRSASIFFAMHFFFFQVLFSLACKYKFTFALFLRMIYRTRNWRVWMVFTTSFTWQNIPKLDTLKDMNPMTRTT